MYKQALDKLLMQKKLPKSVMLYGDCTYLRDIYLEKIASFYGPKEDRLVYYFDEYDFKSAKNFISQSSLFGNLNILIIKSEKNIPKKELEALLKVCQANKNSYFIFEYFGTSAKAKDISKIFSKKFSADFVRFFKPNSYEAVNFLQEYAKNILLDIDRYAIEVLYRMQNEELSLCVKELEKLSIMKKKIDARDVERYSFGLGIATLDKLMEQFILKKDISDIISQMQETVNSNEVFIINSFENFLTQLFMFHIYIKSHGTFNAKEILGYPLPPQLASKRAELSIKINLSIYKRLFMELAKIELTLKKSTQIDKNSFFISSLIKLQSFL